MLVEQRIAQAPDDCVRDDSAQTYSDTAYRKCRSPRGDEAIQTFMFDRPNEALGMRIRIRRPPRGLHNAVPLDRLNQLLAELGEPPPQSRTINLLGPDRRAAIPVTEPCEPYPGRPFSSLWSE